MNERPKFQLSSITLDNEFASLLNWLTRHLVQYADEYPEQRDRYLLSAQRLASVAAKLRDKVATGVLVADVNKVMEIQLRDILQGLNYIAAPASPSRDNQRTQISYHKHSVLGLEGHRKSREEFIDCILEDVNRQIAVWHGWVYLTVDERSPSRWLKE